MIVLNANVNYYWERARGKKETNMTILDKDIQLLSFYKLHSSQHIIIDPITEKLKYSKDWIQLTQILRKQWIFHSTGIIIYVLNQRQNNLSNKVKA